VDHAVIEVGLGGRFDSTNVVRAAVSVITRIELEHEDVLGPGLRSIAWNKAGIIRTDAPVVVARQEPDAIDTIEQEAAETGAPTYLEGRDWSLVPKGADLSFRFGDISLDELFLNLPGEHNRSNAGAALTAVSLALTPDPLNPSVTRRDLAEVRVPGRFERVSAGTSSRAWVLDVAHTRESIARLLDSASSEPDLDGFAVMLALLDDKPAEAILETIAGRTDELILPEINHPRAIPARRLAEIAGAFGIDAHVAPDLESAVALATTLDRPIIVTGSFTLVGHVLGALAENRNPIA
jgi:dihydrofolate synthase/folylpolyglutamate synthase